MKTLGSWLDCAVDVWTGSHELAEVSRNLQGTYVPCGVSLTLKVCLYDMYIHPIMLHNRGTLGLTKFWQNRHLRRHILSQSCQQRSHVHQVCSTHPMSWEVRQANGTSWHVLWLLPPSPPLPLLKSLWTFMLCHPNSQEWRVSWKTPDQTGDGDGEVRTAAAQTLSYLDLKLTHPRDLGALRGLATDRGAWKTCPFKTPIWPLSLTVTLCATDADLLNVCK